MLNNLIVLPDGTEIASGLYAKNTIQNVMITASANSDTELKPGSVCADALEAKFYTPAGNLNLSVGTEVALFKVADDGAKTQVGLFTLEEPERPSRNTYKFTAYDRVSWLDKDLTVWLSNLDGWPYSMFTLAQMVCEECLLTLANLDIPNGDFPVNKFRASKITGREIMGYIGQLAGRFCRATPEGLIEFSWYEDSGIMLEPTGDRYFFTLKYEDYQVEKIDAVQIQLANAEYGALWPEVSENANRYILTGNPLITSINNDLLPYLQNLQQEIQYSIYTPCNLTLPANVDIKPGQILHLKDSNGLLIDTYVMEKTQKGQKETIKSYGSARRDRPTAMQKTTIDYVDDALKRQTQFDIFNKLTNYGQVQGIFMEQDGQIYVNAEYISTGVLQSKDGRTFFLDLDNGVLNMDAQSISIGGKTLDQNVLENLTQAQLVNVLTAEGAADGIYLKDGQLYINAEYIVTGTLNASLITAGILKSKDGKAFNLDLDKGTFSMQGTGRFMSPDGKSYITIEGDTFCLYSQQGEDGDFLPIARIGFSEDSEGYDYPYVLLGNDTDEGSSRLGLVKQFANGVYIGNSAPRLSTGNFVGLAGAVGFFINTKEGRTYNVYGENIYDSFTAVFA